MVEDEGDEATGEYKGEFQVQRPYMKYCRWFASQLKERLIRFEGTSEPGNV